MEYAIFGIFGMTVINTIWIIKLSRYMENMYRNL